MDVRHAATVQDASASLRRHRKPHGSNRNRANHLLMFERHLITKPILWSEMRFRVAP